jgi:thiamine pyrophosphate-dependent acetolactate synthase large subunit-like protein
MTATVAEVMVATLKTSGVRRVYGLPRVLETATSSPKASR